MPDERIMSQPEGPQAREGSGHPDERIAAQPSTAASPAGEADGAEPDSEYRRVLDYLKHQGGIAPETADERRILAGLEAEGLVRKEGNTYLYAGDQGGQKPEGRAIGGWLALPAIGLVVGPLMTLWAIYTDLNVAGRADLDPGVHNILVVELLLCCGLLLFQGYVAVAFFRRKRAARSLMIALYITGVVVTLIECQLVAFITGRDDYSNVARPAAIAAIWVPYFLLSKRVKETFVY